MAFWPTARYKLVAYEHCRVGGSSDGRFGRIGADGNLAGSLLAGGLLVGALLEAAATYGTVFLLAATTEGRLPLGIAVLVELLRGPSRSRAQSS